MLRSAQQRRLLDPPCSVASFEVNSEPHNGALPSVRLCVGLNKLTGRQLSAQNLQRGRQLQRSEPQRELLKLELTGASRTFI